MKEYINLKPGWKTLVLEKLKKYQDTNQDFELSGLQVELHNASWCPDCEREVTDFIAWLNTVQNEAIDVQIYEYEDKEFYKKQKSEGLLQVKCLPTIIFKKSEKEILRIEETSDKDFLYEMQKLYKKLGK